MDDLAYFEMPPKIVRRLRSQGNQNTKTGQRSKEPQGIDPETETASG
jgi:hypothetical protein